MEHEGHGPSADAGSTADNAWIGKIVVAGIVLYFARMAMPMLEYYDNLGVGAIMWRNANGFFEAAFALIMMWSLPALGVVTVGVPLLTYLARHDPTVETVGLGFVALGPLGWYIGRTFSETYARKAVCDSQSFFGLGCTLEGEPMVSFFLFSITLVVVSIIVGLMLLGFFLKSLVSRN